jgi:hypothetical protein
MLVDLRATFTLPEYDYCDILSSNCKIFLGVEGAKQTGAGY